MNTVFRINRRLDPGEYHLEEVFADIRTYGILRAIFADEEEIAAIIAQTKVFLVDRPREMFVDNDDGSINIGLMHLRRTSDVILYLDIIHELCHVKQHLEGRNLYDRTKSYVDRETEIEAYRVTVQEARRIGLNDAAITNYLCVSWITPEEHQRLVRRMVDGRKRQNRCSSRTTSPAQTTF
jgi:predicted SprT family Zn-dependent metalloprotease